MQRKKCGKKEIQKGYKEYACDLCGSGETIEMPHVREYTKGQVIDICKRCGFVYVKQRRSYDKIAEVWSKELFGKTYTAKTPLMIARHNYVAEFIDQKLLLKGKRLCDIGAGEGQFLNIAKNNYGASVLGIEPSAHNCALLTELGIKNFQGTIEEYVAAPEARRYKADIVTMMWTLENATSCKGLLVDARSILRDDGYLVIATGSRILVPFAKPIQLYFSTNPVDAHAARFSLNTLTSFLNATGYEVAHVNPYLNDAIALCVIARKTAKTARGVSRPDDFREVRDFFKRWHKESMRYKDRNATIET